MFAMLLRYKALQGGLLEARLGTPVWSALMASLGVGFECLASPLNAHLQAYGSAADTDGPFGSRGSFLAFKPTSGSYAVHPPQVRAPLPRTPHDLPIVSSGLPRTSPGPPQDLPLDCPCMQVPSLMLACAAHIDGLLRAAAEAAGSHALSFVVILPGNLP
jgi:hypothetical protein